MRKILALLLSVLLTLSLIACNTTTVVAPESSTPETSINTEVTTDPTTESVPDLNANAIAILEDMIGPRIGNEDFIDTVLAYVPDVFMLKEYRCACWTYFLVMEDGLEYIIITDYDGKITSISEWYPDVNEVGLVLYEIPVVTE